jgi:hypothetical protein
MCTTSTQLAFFLIIVIEVFGSLSACMIIKAKKNRITNKNSVMGQPNQCTMYGYPDLSH